MKLRSLDDIHRDLAEGLSRALVASAPRRLAEADAARAADAVLRGQGLPGDVAAVFGERPVCRLLCFDADRIQNWVFASERVQVAAGASFTLDELNRRARQAQREIPGALGTLYSAGGGGILFAGAAEPAEHAVGTLRDWLEQRSHELTFTVLAEDLYVRDLVPGSEPRALGAGTTALGDRFLRVTGMQAALVRTQVRMQTMKDSHPRFQPAPSLAVRRGSRTERCPSCGRRERGGAPLYWCDWCSGLRQTLLDRRRRQAFERQGKRLTFADLAQAVKRRRPYLGFIAIDGNAMGSLVQGMRSFVQLRAFSEATTGIYEAARRRGVEELAAGYLRDKWEPEDAHLSLLSGGDEITLVLPAAAAPPVTTTILRAVEAGFDEATAPGGLLHAAFRDEAPLLERLRRAGAAAGVITAHSHYPVRLLRRYAEELQKKHAKQACAAENGPRSAVAWRLLTDASPLTRSLARGPDLSELGLEAFEDLIAGARAARDSGVAASAFHGVLGNLRREERSLQCLAGAEKEQVLGLVCANYFRYQLARNRQLRRWWQQPGVAPVGGGGDGVARWLRAGGGRRLERLVELLSLEPFPKRLAEEAR